MKRCSILGFIALTMVVLMATASCSNKNKSEAVVEDSIVEDSIVPPTINAEYILHVAGTDNVSPDSVAMVTTESGLKYVTITEGSGKAPTADDTVMVHYTGKLTDGSVFDSSYQRGEPATFPLSGVIAGWTEGLQYMKEGGKTIFYIPAELAYGSRELPGIPANSPLIFEVELLQVQ